MNPFDVLQEEFIESCLERHPPEASYIGYTDYDTEMPSGTLKDRQKRN